MLLPFHSPWLDGCHGGQGMHWHIDGLEIGCDTVVNCCLLLLQVCVEYPRVPKSS